MGVRINPCFGCPLKEGCELRDEWRQKVLGLGLRSVWFVCSKLTAEVRPGRRIEITHPIVECVDIGRYGTEELEVVRKKVKATVTYVKGKEPRFGCVLDPGQLTDEELFDQSDPDKPRFRRIQSHRRLLRFLDEPDLPVCKHSNVQRDGQCDSLGVNECHCKRDEGTAKLCRELAS